MKHYIISTTLILSFLFSGNITAQTYHLKDSISSEEQGTFTGKLRRVFPLQIELAYNITSNDTQVNYEDMVTRTTYDEIYKKAYLDSLKSDEKNPFYIAKLAYYYQQNMKNDSASIYFNKALSEMKLDHFDKDSAKFYSFRSTLKYNLNMPSTEKDILSTLRLNPTDANAIGMYSIYLIQNEKYDQAKEMCAKAIGSKENTSELPMIMYAFSEIFSQASFYGPMSQKEKAEHKSKDVMKLINFKSINKIYKKAKNIQVSVNAYEMSKILALVMKAMLFEQDENNNPILDYSKNDIKLINQLIQWNEKSLTNKTLNKFAANKNLAFLHWMKGENDTLIKHATLAIRDFPIEKSSDNFDANDIFSVALLSYKMQENYQKLGQSLYSDIEAKKIVNLNSIQSHVNLAKLYLYEGNLKKCAEHCVIAKEIDGQNIELNRVITHYHFVTNNMEDFQAYLNICRDQKKSESEIGRLALQLGFYNLYFGDAQEAFNTLTIAKSNLEKCPICDDLIEKYIEVLE